MARYHIHTDEKEPKDSIRDRFVNLTRLHRALCLGYLLSNVRLIVFSWVLFVILGRYFTMILFSFELVLSVVFVLFGSQFYYITKGRSIGLKIASFVYLTIELILNITILVLGFKYTKLLLYEPNPINRVHEDLNFVWRHWIAFVSLTAMTIVLQIAIVVVNIFHIIASKKIEEDDEEVAQLISMPRTAKFILASLHFLFLAAGFVMFVMSIASISRAFSSGSSCQGCNDKCDPLIPKHCMLPFPSSFHLKTDTTTNTGYRVNISPKTLPSLKSGEKFEPIYFNELDGFSTIAQIAFYLEGAINDTLVDAFHIEDSLAVDSSTILLDAETLTLHPHWIELDIASGEDNPLLLMQPAQPLKFATRYIIGVRGVMNDEGTLITPSDEFRILMDNHSPSDPSKTSRWNHYQNNIIPKLIDAGYTDLDEFQLVWDFVTVSRNSSLGHAEIMRDLSLNYVDNTNVQYEILSDKKHSCSDPSDHIARSVHVSLLLPNYLETKQKMSRIPRVDGERDIRTQSMKRHNIYIRIPCSIVETPQPAERIIQYGHGLFGTRNAISSSWINQMAHENKWIFVASDWNGMSRFDLLSLGKILLFDYTDFIDLPESLVQGWANLGASLRFITNQLSKTDDFIIDGVPILNCSEYVYYGNSQGSVIGGGYLANSRDIKKGILHVPGSPFGSILSRSGHFSTFRMLLGLNLYNSNDLRLTLILVQQLWDPGESGGWLSSMNQNPGNGVPAKNVLLQAVYGDSSVTTLGAAIMARAYGADLLVPYHRDVFGLNPRAGPYSGSALVEFYYNDSHIEYPSNTPPRGGRNHHICLRYEPEIINQNVDFVTNDIVRNYCDGQCIKERCVHLLEDES